MYSTQYDNNVINIGFVRDCYLEMTRSLIKEDLLETSLHATLIFHKYFLFFLLLSTIIRTFHHSLV